LFLLWGGEGLERSRLWCVWIPGVLARFPWFRSIRYALGKHYSCKAEMGSDSGGTIPISFCLE
jgi:hypothetical protein